MRRIRFTIASLLVVVSFVAVGFVALREASEIWDSGVFTLTIGVLLVSILLAVHRIESRRAFCIGFALFGWTYLGLSLITTIESRLITTRALTFLDSKVPGRFPAVYTIQFAGSASGSPSNQVQSIAFTAVGNQRDVNTGRLLGGWSGSTENFIRIGHSLLALLAGWLGGQLSRRLCRSSRRPEASTAVDVEGTNP